MKRAADPAPTWWSDRTALALALMLAAIAAAAFLPNDWIQDEFSRIVFDGRVRSWNGLWRGFTESYWAPPSKSGLYRPLVMTTFTLQWILGGARVLVFRVVDIVAYLGATWAMWRLARTFLDRTAAFVATALFAVHPLHTEILAVAVNQAECVVTICLVAATLLWRDLARGTREARTTVPIVALLYLTALAFKENGLVLPGLLLAVEVTAPEGGSWRTRLRARGGALLGLLILGAAWWGLRAHVLGDLAGAAPAEGLRDRGLVARLTLMLGVVPEWTRLFVWPAVLRMDYSPRQVDPDAGWGAMQWLGVLLLVGWAAALRWAWRADRTVVFGLLWIPVGLIPVNNVVMPSGTLLAERTLLLPSVGVLLVVGALVARAEARWLRSPGPARIVAAVGFLVLLGLALVRDYQRAPDWKNSTNFVAAELRDSPQSFHALTAYGIWAFENGDPRTGEASLREAIRLWPYHARPYQTLADYYRGDGFCEPALALYRVGVGLESDRPRQRISAAACALWLGQYDVAAVFARGTPVVERDVPRLAQEAALADSAQRVHAPPHTVRMPPSRDHTEEVGWRHQ